MQLSTRIEKYDVWKRKSPTLKSSMPRSAEEAWKRACPPTLRNREALSTLSTLHVRIFKHSATGVLLHTRTHKYVHIDDNMWCYSAPLVTLQGGALWQCCHIFHCPLVTSRLVVAPLHQLVRLHQSSNLVIEKTGFSWTSPTVYTHITCMCLCLLCLHGEMLPDVIQLQAFYGIFWVSGFSSLSWAEVPLNFTLKLLS